MACSIGSMIATACLRGPREINSTSPGSRICEGFTSGSVVRVSSPDSLAFGEMSPI